jgi:hypothetical protein
LRDGSGGIQSPILQSLIEPLPVVVGRNDHRRISGSQCVTDEAAEFVEKEAIFSVELDDMSFVLMVTPTRLWRG